MFIPSKVGFVCTEPKSLEANPFLLIEFLEITCLPESAVELEQCQDENQFLAQSLGFCLQTASF